MIVTTSLLRDFLPSSWANFHATIVDILTATGTVGIFFTLFPLFIRFVPIMNMSEIKATLPGNLNRTGRRRSEIMSHHLVNQTDHRLPVAGSEKEALYAIGARFDSPDAIVKAAERLKGQGFRATRALPLIRFMVSPRQCAAKKSILSFLVLGGGVSAVLIALSMELIPRCVIYPLVVDGKPLNLSALPQYVPITVALTLMIGARLLRSPE